MESARILIAMKNEESAIRLKTILSEHGYIVVGCVSDGQECLRKTSLIVPDLVVLDYDLSSLNGYEVAKIIIEDKLAAVVLIASEMRKGTIVNLNSEESFVCVSKPLVKSNLLNTIELLIKNKRKIDALQKQLNELNEILSTRKEVEKAKGLLMKNLNLSEAEAFKRIQKQSMDKGISMKEIAKAIILAYNI